MGLVAVACFVIHRTLKRNGWLWTARAAPHPAGARATTARRRG